MSPMAEMIRARCWVFRGSPSTSSERVISPNLSSSAYLAMADWILYSELPLSVLSDDFWFVFMSSLSLASLAASAVGGYLTRCDVIAGLSCLAVVLFSELCVGFCNVGCCWVLTGWIGWLLVVGWLMLICWVIGVFLPRGATPLCREGGGYAADKCGKRSGIFVAANVYEAR
jgi:hypothetical protein